MPAKSAKQYKLMQAIANDHSNKTIGPSKEVAKHFIEETPKKKRRLFMKGKK